MSPSRDLNTPPQDASGAPLAGFDAHRAMAREFDLRAQRVYSLGGSLAIGAGLLPLLAGWWAGRLLTLMPWVFAVTLALVALFFVRSMIRSRLALVRQDLSRYCEVNALSMQDFTAHYAQREEYAFFAALSPRTQEALDS